MLRKSSLIGLFAYEFEGGVDNDHRTFARHLLGDAVAAHDGVEIEELGVESQVSKPLLVGFTGLVGWQEPTCHLPK